MRLFVIGFVSVIAAIACEAQGKTVASETSSVTFTIRNFGLQVEGSFSALKGKITFDEKELSTAAFDLEVAANTIATGIELRNNHLKKGEYFDTDKYPALRFVSTKVEKLPNSTTYNITGRLTVKNVTREVQIPTSVLTTNHGNTFEGSFQVNRRDYGVGGSSMSLSDNVTVKFSIKTTNTRNTANQ